MKAPSAAASMVPFGKNGVSMIGENATELIHIGLTVLDKGLTIDAFIEHVFNYPTLSETYKYAAYDGLGNLAGHKLREG